VALLIGACVVAFAFRVGGRSPAADRRPAPNAQPERAPLSPEPSRAQRLAFDLQRDPAYAEARGRTLQLAAATVSTARAPANAAPPPRLGDDYRRPAPTTRRLKVSR
jgi:hypothetical protein